MDKFLNNLNKMQKIRNEHLELLNTIEDLRYKIRSLNKFPIEEITFKSVVTNIRLVDNIIINELLELYNIHLEKEIEKYEFQIKDIENQMQSFNYEK